jgi:UDP-glucuronate 4-epimerase
MQRDFTYISDIIEGIIRVIYKLPERNPDWSSDSPDPATSYCRYKIYNIGNSNPVKLSKFIEHIEKALGIAAKKEYLDIQPGDVPATYADVDDLINDVGFKPSTPLAEGVGKFIEWYKKYYL